MSSFAYIEQSPGTTVTATKSPPVTVETASHGLTLESIQQQIQDLDTLVRLSASYHDERLVWQNWCFGLTAGVLALLLLALLCTSSSSRAEAMFHVPPHMSTMSLAPAPYPNYAWTGPLPPRPPSFATHPSNVTAYAS